MLLILPKKLYFHGECGMLMSIRLRPKSPQKNPNSSWLILTILMQWWRVGSVFLINCLYSCLPFSQDGATLSAKFSVLCRGCRGINFAFFLIWQAGMCHAGKKSYTLFITWTHHIPNYLCTFQELWLCRRALSLTVLGATYMIYNHLHSQWFVQGTYQVTCRAYASHTIY